MSYLHEPQQATDDEVRGSRAGAHEIVVPKYSTDSALIGTKLDAYLCNTDVTASNIEYKDDVAGVSPQLLKEIMMDCSKESNTDVCVAQFLLIVGGLPDCGKSKLLMNLLSNVFKKPRANVMKGILKHCSDERMDYYELAAFGPSRHNKYRVQYTDTTRETYYRYAFESVLRRYVLDRFNTVTQVYEPTDHGASIFGDVELDRHFFDVYESLRQNHIKSDDKTSADSWERRGMPDKIAVINIWDLGISKSVYHFVSAFCGHLYNSYVWSFLDLQRDVKNALHKRFIHVVEDLPPESRFMGMNESDGFMRWHSRLRYYVRSASFAKSETPKPRCTLFAAHDSHTSDDELKKELEFLSDQVESTAAYFKVRDLIDSPIVRMQKGVKLSTKKMKELFGCIIKKELESPSAIPLSCIFLRTLFYKKDELYITKDCLREKAKKLGILNLEEDFCKFFTSSGSIFDVSLIDPSCQYVITKPMGFLRQLDKLFYPCAQDKIIADYGLLTEEKGQELFQEHIQFFMEVLCAVHTALKVKSARVNLQGQTPPGEYCYYIPGARTTAPDTNCKRRVLHLTHSVAVPVKRFLPTFVKTFMQKNATSKLMCISDNAASNAVTIRAFPDDVENHIDVTAVRIGDSIEFRLPEDTVSKQLCHSIIESCLEVMSTKAFQNTFNFSFICSKADEIRHEQNMLNRPRHIFSMINKKECAHCKEDGIYDLEIIKTWKTVIEDFKIDTTRIMNGEPLDEEDLITIIQKMKKATEKIWLGLLPELNKKLELEEHVNPWPDQNLKCLLEMILKWEQQQKQLEHEASKREFARIMYSAAAAVESFDKEETDLIDEVVRALDMTAISSTGKSNY